MAMRPSHARRSQGRGGRDKECIGAAHERAAVLTVGNERTLPSRDRAQPLRLPSGGLAARSRRTSSWRRHSCAIEGRDYHSRKCENPKERNDAGQLDDAKGSPLRTSFIAELRLGHCAQFPCRHSSVPPVWLGEGRTRDVTGRDRTIPSARCGVPMPCVRQHRTMHEPHAHTNGARDSSRAISADVAAYFGCSSLRWRRKSLPA